MMKILEKLKPAVAKRTLLLIAGCAWSIAGGILITRALVQLITIDHWLVNDIIAAVILGLVFYFLLFARISKKHIYRITMIKIDNPCFFSFFNFRSYLLMTIMITTGITVRKLQIVNKEILYSFLLCMGIPLLISAYRFFYSWVKNKTLT